MPSPLLHYVSSTAALPQYCDPTSSFLAAISSYLRMCIPTPLALVSSFLGGCSILSWLFAQLPQIYKNYQLKSTSGLSIYFLVEWCLGDTSNLVGALLTRQAGWQVVIAAYYVLVDVTLVFQFFWYTHYHNRRGVYGEVSRSHHDGGAGSVLDGVPVSGGGDNSVRHAVSRESTKQSETKSWNYALKGKSPASSSNSQSLGYSNEKHNSASRRPITRAGSNSTPPPGLASTRTLLVASMLCTVMANASPTETTQPQPPITNHKDTLEFIGRIFSWMSTVLYLASRPPQLYKNYTRKSTAGLSPLLFIAAFGGNLFYSASLLTNPYAWYDLPPYGGGGWADEHGSDRVDWMSRSIPFFLGAFGVLFFDGFMGVQFLMYGDPDGEEPDDEPKHGRSRWTRVHGWMSGWIPSIISPPGRCQQQQPLPSQESEALLGEERGRYGAV